MKPQHLGILGGMGPVATAHFYESVIRHALDRGAKRDADFPRISLASAIIPGFDAHGFTDSTLVRDEIIKGARALEAAGADLIAMPCNTAHAFFNELQASVQIPVLNIVEVTLDAVFANSCRTVAILGTESTVEEDVYAHENLELVELTSEEQAVATLLIERGEEGKYDATDTERLKKLTKGLMLRGVEGVILGCTELSTIPLPNCTIPFFDSSALLAKEAVRICYES